MNVQPVKFHTPTIMIIVMLSKPCVLVWLHNETLGLLLIKSFVISGCVLRKVWWYREIKHCSTCVCHSVFCLIVTVRTYVYILCVLMFCFKSGFEFVPHFGLLINCSSMHLCGCIHTECAIVNCCRKNNGLMSLEGIFSDQRKVSAAAVLIAYVDF